MVSRPNCRQQIDEEAKHPECENDRDCPLQDCTDVGFFIKSANGECNSKDDFDNDKDELDPKRNAKDAVLAKVHTKALILGANKDGRDDVPSARYSALVNGIVGKVMWEQT